MSIRKNLLPKSLPEPLDTLRAAVFPDRCNLCGNVVAHGVTVCDQCKESAKVIRAPRCISCGKAKKNCKCKGRSNFYNGITAPFDYEGVVRKGISLWKFQKAERNVYFFADMIVSAVNEAFEGIEFDLITFIPQTETERKSRTYNQCEQLASAIGEKTGIPVIRTLTKLYETERQHNLPLISRSGNVFGIFDCCNKNLIADKNILLIDDIKTSGNTINECAKMLHLSGAASVYCAVIAIA